MKKTSWYLIAIFLIHFSPDVIHADPELGVIELTGGVNIRDYTLENGISPRLNSPHLSPHASEVTEVENKNYGLVDVKTLHFRPRTEAEIFKDATPVKLKTYPLSDENASALGALLLAKGAILTDATSDKAASQLKASLEGTQILSRFIGPEEQSLIANSNRKVAIRIGDFVFLPPNQKGEIFAVDWVRYVGEVNHWTSLKPQFKQNNNQLLQTARMRIAALGAQDSLGVIDALNSVESKMREYEVEYDATEYRMKNFLNPYLYMPWNRSRPLSE